MKATVLWKETTVKAKPETLARIKSGRTYCLHCGGFEPGVPSSNPRAACSACTNLVLDADDQMAVESLVMRAIQGHAHATLKRHPYQGNYLSIEARQFDGRMVLGMEIYADRPPLCAALIMTIQAMRWYHKKYVPPYGGGGGTSWAGGFGWEPNYKEWKGMENGTA